MSLLLLLLDACAKTDIHLFHWKKLEVKFNLVNVHLASERLRCLRIDVNTSFPCNPSTVLGSPATAPHPHDLMAVLTVWLRLFDLD